MLIKKLRQTAPIPKKPKRRKDQDLVHIDGKQTTWGDFKKKFSEDVQRRQKKGAFTFTMNKGDPDKEKKLYWN